MVAEDRLLHSSHSKCLLWIYILHLCDFLSSSPRQTNAITILHLTCLGINFGLAQRTLKELMETPKPKYPPPITTLPFVMKRKCTSDGRLILTMEKPHDDDDEDMKAHRSNDDDVKDVNVSESGSKLVIIALLKITIRRKLALYMQNHHRKNPVKRTIVKKWIPPSDDELKFNMDGSVTWSWEGLG
ncbi:hypothetical protein QYF36_007164 [Acer negundo]|nr:hypothetical protein QYF36_007164 [Acer negundo]